MSAYTATYTLTAPAFHYVVDADGLPCVGDIGEHVLQTASSAILMETYPEFCRRHEALAKEVFVNRFGVTPTNGVWTVERVEEE